MSAFLHDLQFHQMAQVVDTRCVVALVGYTMKRSVVIPGTSAERTAAPVGQQPVCVIHLGYKFRPAAAFLAFGDPGDLDDPTGEHQQGVEVGQLGEGDPLSDAIVDTYNNTSIVQHCEGPWNAWGDERRVPYYLVDHRERTVRGRSVTGGSAASWILYPGDEPVTMWQVDVSSKEVLVHTGTTVPMLTRSALYGNHFYSMM